MTTIAYLDTIDDFDTGASDVKGVYCPPCAEIVAGEQTHGDATADEVMEPVTVYQLTDEVDGHLWCCDRCRRLLIGADRC